MLSEALPVVELITKRGMKVDSRCQVCGDEGESIKHVILSCSLARQVWTMSNIPSHENGFECYALFSNLSFFLSVYKNRNIPQKTRTLIPWLVWFI